MHLKTAKWENIDLKEGEDDLEDEQLEETQVRDMTDTDLLRLREAIYLVIMNSIDFEECAHKLLKMNIGKGHEGELCNMISDCCMQERTYTKFYGLLAERFCMIDAIYKQHFFRIFVEVYTRIHNETTNKIRNIAKMFAHLLYTDALDWHVLKSITITEEMTTSSSRIFLKIFFQELAENLGIQKFNEKIKDKDMAQYYEGLFPTDHPKNTRFAINFFSMIGLNAVTSELREELDNMTKLSMIQQLQAEKEKESSDSDSSSGSSDSDSSSNSDSDSSSSSDS